MEHTFPRLIADIGGTNARFSLEVSPYQYKNTQVLQCSNYRSLTDAVNEYFRLIGTNDVKHTAIALPTPISGDSIYMVNNPWQTLSIAATQEELQLKNLVFLNDFHALALAIPHIEDKHLIKIGGQDADFTKPRGIIGPGTGLGVASLVCHHNGEYQAVPAEGGHVSFAPVNGEELELWQFVHRRFHHVSFERFVSGPGLQLIYEAVCFNRRIIIEQMPTPSEITTRAVNRECWISQITLDHFCRMLGSVASNLAITINAFGGIYIGGGVVPKILDYFKQSDFRGRFEDKGRMRKYLEKIPVFVITEEFPAFLGLSYALDTKIKSKYLP